VRWPALLVLAALSSGCPEERDGTRRQVPAARLPPAMPVETPPSTLPAERLPASGATSGR